MKHVILLAAVCAVGMSSFSAEVMKVSEPVKIDGVLDEAVWKNAKWEGGFKSVATRAKKEPAAARTEFALATDGDTLYVAARCHDPDIAAVKSRPDVSLWVTDDIEFFFAPDGTSFQFYQFAFSPNSKDVAASFWSEGGTIEPEPYAPKWSHAVGYEGDAWTAEAAFPLSAFYNTRNAVWKDEWRVNVARTCTSRAVARHITWSPLEVGYREPKAFRTVKGFPMRRTADDLMIESAEAVMTGERDGKLAGRLKLRVVSPLDGEYTVGSSVGESVKTKLAKGVNTVEIPCVYEKNGRFRTWFAVTDRDGRTCERGYPVIVDYRPVRVKLTTPAYRNNFYPGQNADRVAGHVKNMSGGDCVVTLEGEGFPKRELVVKGGEGDFSFDTTGFRQGTDARLTVVEVESPGRTKEPNHLSSTSTLNFNSSTSTSTSTSTPSTSTSTSTPSTSTFDLKIRNLAPSKGGMAWVENGHLVVNGKPVLRRTIYADGYKCGRRFSERFAKDRESFMMTPFPTGSITLDAAMERTEGVQDREIGEKHRKILDAILEKNRETPIVGYYIADEPECRNLSPIYLKSMYDYVAKKDPYRIVFTASRGGSDFAECADLFETHPYLSIRNDEKGRRVFGNHPRDLHRYLENFGVLGRPDKCVGFLPTAFAYRWTSNQNDYPTLDEYIAHVWAALIAGAKTLWPYAGHDLGDRPALYEGCRHTFRQAAVLQDLLLLGKYTRFPRANDVDRATWELNGEKLTATVDYRTMKTTLDMPKKYRDRIGGQYLKWNVDRWEGERRGRDNQLRGRYDEITVKSGMERNWGGGVYKLVDGTRDFMAARSNGAKDEFLELSFAFTPEFDRVRVWGLGLGNAVLSFADGKGGWTAQAARPEPKGDYVEFVLGGPVKAGGLRLDLKGDRAKPQQIEIYEIELPRVVRFNPTVKYLQRTMETLENSTAENPARLRVAFYGQSIVAQGWADRVIGAWRAKYPTARIDLENRAIGGFGSDALVRTIWSDVYPYYPDVLFFHVYGPLDKYEEIIRTVRAKTTAEIVLWSSHMAAADDPERKLAEPDERTRGIAAIAAKYHCVFVDLNRKWAEYLLANHLPQKALLKDTIHLDQLKGSLEHYARFIAEDLVRIPGAKGDAASGAITVLPGGVKRVEFTGNRLVGVVSKPGRAKVTFDGRPIEENADMYCATRTTAMPMWMPALKRVQWKTAPLAQKWKLVILPDSAEDGSRIHFKVSGSLTGDCGEGDTTGDFLSTDGRCFIEKQDYGNGQYRSFRKKVDPSRAVEWETKPQYDSPCAGAKAGDRVVIASGCANGRHVVEFDGDLEFAEFVEYRPADASGYSPVGDIKGGAGDFNRRDMYDSDPNWKEYRK